jgi:hypothetical protein
MNDMMRFIGMGSGGSSGQDLVQSGMQNALGFLVDPNSAVGMFANDLIESEAAPWLRKKMFGDDPFAAYGGMGNTWNMVSRMRETNNRKMKGYMNDQMSQVIDQANEDMYQAMLKDNPELEGTATGWMRKMSLQGGAMLSGSKDIGKSFFKNAANFGYIPGMPGSIADAGKQDDIRRDMINSAKTLTRDFVMNREDYGNLTGKELGTLIDYEAQRGGIDIRDPEKLKERMKKTARSIAGIRDILKGPMTEVVQQLQNTFGEQSISVMGLDKAAGQLQSFRQFAEMTGTTVGQVAQYSQMAGNLSKQVGGDSFGQGVMGLGIASYMAGGYSPGTTRGVDQDQYRKDVVKKNVGAHKSKTGMKIYGAIAEMRRQGMSEEDISKFKKAALDTARTSEMTSEQIAELSGLSVKQVEIGQYTAGAEDVSAEDNTGKNVALIQTRRDVLANRKDQLMKWGNYKEGDEFKTLRELEKEKDDSGQLRYKDGIAETAFDELAAQNNFAGDDAMMQFFRKQDNAMNLENRARRMGELAQKFSQIGGTGGLGGILTSLGKGENIVDIGKKFMGLADDDTTAAFYKEMFGEAGGDANKMQEFLTGKDKGGQLSAVEKAARQKIVKEAVTSMQTGFDASGKKVDRKEMMKKAQDGTLLTEEMEKIQKDAGFQLDMFSGGEAGGFDALSYEKKQQTMTDFIKTQLASSGKLSKGDMMEQREGESSEEYLKRLQTKVSTIAADDKDAFKEGMVDVMTQEISKSTEDWLGEIKGAVDKIVGLIPSEWSIFGG